MTGVLQKAGVALIPNLKCKLNFSSFLTLPHSLNAPDSVCGIQFFVSCVFFVSDEVMEWVRVVSLVCWRRGVGILFFFVVDLVLLKTRITVCRLLMSVCFKSCNREGIFT